MNSFLTIFLAAILTDNFVLTRLLGATPFIGSSKKAGPALNMGIAVTLVMVAAAALTWPVQYFLLAPFGLDHLKMLVFIAIIVVLVQLLPLIFKGPRFGKALPLVATNSAILGSVLLYVDYGLGFGASMVHALGAGIGFLVAVILFSGIKERLDSAPIPEFFKGMPITLMAAAFLAVSFMGFQGMF